MELLETGKKEIHNVNAHENGWKLRATVTVEGGKVINIDGSAAYGEEKDGMTPYEEMTRFNGWKEGDALRIAFDFRHEDADVCDILKAMVDAIIARYEV
jgi:hypothetical protein